MERDNHPRITYSRERLLEIGKSVLSSEKTLRVPAESWENIKRLDLGTALKTRRGNKGGKGHNHTDNIPSPTSEVESNMQNNEEYKNKSKSQLKIGLLNCRSIRNKTEAIKDHILDYNLDALAIRTVITTNRRSAVNKHEV